MPRFISIWVVLASSAVSPSAEVRIEYPSGGSGCQIVEFPRWALPKDAQEKHNFYDEHFDYGGEYIFRHVENTASELLLVTVSEDTLYKQPPMISRDKYWLDLRRKARIRRATISEWESADPVIEISSGPYHSALGDDVLFEYKGKKFGKPGKRWPPTFDVESARGTWLRLSSDTVQQEAEDGFPTRALTFVDIYHMPTGKRVIALSGTLDDLNVEMSTPNVGYFLEDRFYVAAVSEDRRKMLICDMNRLVPKL